MGSCGGRISAILFLLLLLAVVQTGLGAASSQDGSHGDSNQTDPMCSNTGAEGPKSSIKVASLKFEEVEAPLYVLIFILVVVLAKMGWHHPVMHIIASNIPESCMLIVVGAHLGGILLSIYFQVNGYSEKLPFRFSQELFFLFLLPPIVLEAGYFMNNIAFFENMITILVYAVIGTLWNAFALGFTVWGLSEAGLLSNHCTIASALLFGTICAAVDPVAVLAVFEEIHVNKLLHILVFGESLLNDAVTIVLFLVLSAFANRPFDPRFETSTIAGYEIVLGIVQFFVVVGASILIGLIVGCLAVLMTKYSEHVHVLEPIIVLAMGYLSYILADLFAFSGIVSLIVAAIIMRHYVPANVSEKSRITIKYTIKMLSTVSETIIFMFLGFSLFDAALLKWNTGLVLWTLLFAFIFRPIGVVVLTLIVNIFRYRRIGVRDTFILSFSGLRGAVAFALALTRLFEEGFKHLPTGVQDLRKEQLTAVVVLLLFTVFFQGTTIKPLVQLLHVKKATSEKPTMNQTIHYTAMDHISAGVNDIQGHIGFNTLREWMHWLDVKYLRRIFERRPDAVDDEIVHTFKKLQYREDHIQDQKTSPSVTSMDKDTNDGERPPLGYKEESHHYLSILEHLLKKSFFHPHREHLGHQLSPQDWEQREHHVEKDKLKFHVRQRVQLRRHLTVKRRHTTAFGMEELERLEREMEEVGEGREKRLRPRCMSADYQPAGSDQHDVEETEI